MQSDKAFLEHGGRPFVALIAEETLRVSKDVLVIIGTKDKTKFEAVLPGSVRVANDAYYTGSPLGGMLTAFELFTSGYVAVLACDIPFIRADVLKFIYDSALSHSAAVPLWESGRLEPLCSVYDAKEAGIATRNAVRSGGTRCKDIISLLRDVNYIPASRLRALDPSMGSLLNLNTPGELASASISTNSPTAASGRKSPTPVPSGGEA